MIAKAEQRQLNGPHLSASSSAIVLILAGVSALPGLPLAEGTAGSRIGAHILGLPSQGDLKSIFLLS